MNKNDFVAKIATETKATKTATEEFVKAYNEVLTDALANGDGLTLVGFGTYKVSATKARKGRNPQTGKEINIPAGKRVSFSAGKTLKEKVNGKSAAKKAKK